jgi:hypothetical protein
MNAFEGISELVWSSPDDILILYVVVKTRPRFGAKRFSDGQPLRLNRSCDAATNVLRYNSYGVR